MLQYILNKRTKRMNGSVSSVKAESTHKTNLRGDHILHEKEYSTGHGMPAISDEIRGEVRCEPCRPQVQQKPVVHLLPAAAPGRKRCIPRRRPHSYPNRHTEEEIRLIRNMRRRNPEINMPEIAAYKSKNTAILAGIA